MNLLNALTRRQILIYQMGKVASSSIESSLKKIFDKRKTYSLVWHSKTIRQPKRILINAITTKKNRHKNGHNQFFT